MFNELWTYSPSMSSSTGERRRPGGRGAGLTREQIVQVALTLVDAEGVDALTVRRLARELEVEPPALYWHFANKDEICRALVAEISAQLHIDTGVQGGPRERLEHHLGAIRAHWRQHPSGLELGRRFPPTVDSETARAGMELLIAFGIPPEAALEHYRVLAWSVMGFVIVEQNLASSVHHQRSDSSSTRWVLAIEGRPGMPTEFDTDALFLTTITFLLDGMIASLD